MTTNTVKVYQIRNFRSNAILCTTRSYERACRFVHANRSLALPLIFVSIENGTERVISRHL